jgi:hypothetical protein
MKVLNFKVVFKAPSSEATGDGHAGEGTGALYLYI